MALGIPYLSRFDFRRVLVKLVRMRPSYDSCAHAIHIVKECLEVPTAKKLFKFENSPILVSET